MTTLFEAFLSSVRRHIADPALVVNETGQHISYGQLLGRVQDMICAIRTQTDWQAGDRVGILMQNEAGFVVSFFALQALGCVTIPLNTRLTPSELAGILNQAQASGVLVSPDFTETGRALHQEVGTVLVVRDDNAQASSWPAETQIVLDANPAAVVDFDGLGLPAPSSSDLAVLIFTSGTTGKPKGIMLSHTNLLADAHANTLVIAARPEDVFVTASPLFHIFGLTNVLLTAFGQGARIVLLKRFSPHGLLGAIERHRVTFLAAVPTMYQMMLSALHEQAYDLSSLRVCHSGAAPMHQAVFHQVEAAFGAPVQEGYGQTEASSIVTSNPLDGPRKPGSIGKALPGLVVEIVDDAGNIQPAGEVGELRVQGETLMLGYWQNEDATAKALRNGCLYTGDLGYTDEDGYIFLVGRGDDMINVGGAKVYPQEVEEVLYQCPGVASCAVKGEASALYTQIVAAYVVAAADAALDAETIISFCQQHLARFKVPQAVYLVPEIPKGPTGKILRHQLQPPETSTPVA